MPAANVCPRVRNTPAGTGRDEVEP
jgi:hypothetical protein